MLMKRMYQIDVDQEVYDFLKSNAEPLVDTANSVLKRYLPLGPKKTSRPPSSADVDVLLEFPPSTPKALQHTMAVLRLVRNLRIDIIQATHVVAKRYGVARETIQDQYTRQLGIRTGQIDDLLTDANLPKLKRRLLDKFPEHAPIIEGEFTIMERLNFQLYCQPCLTSL